MGSMFRSPRQPDPINVGQVTQQANQQNTANAYQNAAFNRVNQTDQYGNTLNYSQTGTDAQGNPIFSAQQGMGETARQFAGGFGGLGQQYFDRAGQGMPSSQGAFDQAYDYASANLEPRMERQRAAMENRLRNQGLDPTSEAYRSSSNDLALQQNEARNNLVTGLQGQMFNQGLQSRQQQMGELQPGLQYGMGAMNPNLVNAPQVGVQNVDVAGLAQANNANQWQGYNAQMQQRNAMLGGLGGIAGTVAGGMFGMPGLGGQMGSMFGGPPVRRLPG